MDLKAFDKVDRRTLWETRKRGIRKGLPERVKEIYESMKSAMRVQGETSEWSEYRKGGQTRMPINPTAALYINCGH